MSATNRGSTREDNDNYATPAYAIKSFLENGPLLPGGYWLEPCAGDGRIINVTRNFRTDVTWYANELREDQRIRLLTVVEEPKLRIGDFLQESWIYPTKFSVIITNPPYSLAEQVIKKSLQISNYVVMLLRLNFLESEARSTWLRANPPDIYVLPNRPSFKKTKKIDKKTGKLRTTSSDACAYAWFCWGPHRDREHGKVKILPAVSKEERMLK